MKTVKEIRLKLKTTDLILVLREAQKHLLSYRGYSDEMKSIGRGHTPSVGLGLSPEYLDAWIERSIARMEDCKATKDLQRYEWLKANVLGSDKDESNAILYVRNGDFMDEPIGEAIDLSIDKSMNQHKRA